MASAANFKDKLDSDNFIDELRDTKEWQTKVMEAKVPVILDCYADWCGPCKKLTPVLEKVTNDYEGKFRLVKLNIDTLPELTRALNVKSVPALFLIYKGNVMD
jgi:thioredoxin